MMRRLVAPQPQMMPMSSASLPSVPARLLNDSFSLFRRPTEKSLMLTSRFSRLADHISVADDVLIARRGRRAESMSY